MTSSTKLICFGKKYQDSLKIGEHPLHQLIRLDRLEIHTTFQIPRLLGDIVLPSLVYPYFELDIEQDEICKALLIKQEPE